MAEKKEAEKKEKKKKTEEAEVKLAKGKKKAKKEEKKAKKKKKRGEKRNSGIIHPLIDAVSFGSITIEGREIGNDVVLMLDGSIQKRKKKLSKKVYGTSHTISLHEARYVYEKGAELLIVGNGHYGRVGLSDEAEKFFKKHGCRVKLKATPKAIHIWNTARGKVIGLFHVTC